MKNIKIRNIKYPDPAINWDFQAEEAEPKLSELLDSGVCGKPERWVLHKDEPMAEAYDEADVLEERTVEDFPAIDAVMDDAGAIVQEAIPARTHREVKLSAEYQIEVIDITEAVAVEKLSTEALRYLESTDWKVLRHIRQKALGITTSMSDEEYLEFELSRVEAANKVIR
jgi:hypothetical protein